jgi:hypothetical protein
LSLLCFFGALAAYRAQMPDAAPFAITLLVFPLVFYVTHSSLRYRFPIDPIMLILATGAVANFAALAGNRNPGRKKTTAGVSPLRAA